MKGGVGKIQNSDLRVSTYKDKYRFHAELNHKMVWLLDTANLMSRHEISAFLGVEYTTWIQWRNHGELLLKTGN